MTEMEFTGKTVDEAIATGLQTMGLKREEADIVVLEEGKKGGLFSKGIKACVRISRKKTDGERAVAFLEGVFDILHVTATTELDENAENTRINVITPNTYALIGHRGEVLDSLQVLAGAVANIGREEYKRVVVDCEGYRDKREQTLRRLANKLAEKAVRLGRKVAIEPMTPYERRIIHSTLADSTEVKTTSEGKEPNRFVVVIPNNLRPGADRPDRRGARPRFGENRGNFDRRPRPYPSRRRDGYEKRDYDKRDYDKRDGFEARDGYEKREGYEKRDSYDKRDGYDRREGYEKRDGYEKRGNFDRRGGYDRRRDDRRGRPRASGLPRSKRQPSLGTYLGNSNDLNKGNDAADPSGTDNGEK